MSYNSSWIKRKHGDRNASFFPQWTLLVGGHSVMVTATHKTALLTFLTSHNYSNTSPTRALFSGSKNVYLREIRLYQDNSVDDHKNALSDTKLRILTSKRYQKNTSIFFNRLPLMINLR